MKRRLLALLGLLLLAGCPGQKPPVAARVEKPAPEEPLVWKVSKSGLGFRLSNADAEADKPAPHKLAATSAVSADEAKRIAARMPTLAADPDDAKGFAMRDKSIPPPRPGRTVNETFPPPPGPPP